MRESRAWRILAKEHDSGRTESRFLCLNLIPFLPDFRNAAVTKIPYPMRLRMRKRIYNVLGHAGPAYFDHFEGERGARVLACLMFSEITK